MKLQRFNRKTHFWGAIICALPIAIVLVTGVLLLLKKDFDWIQPATIKTAARQPALSFEKILGIAMTVPQAGISSWGDISRIDVRPNKGVIKVQSNSDWEIQLNLKTGDVLQVAYRRSNLIESLHDGSFFFKGAKLAVFLPAAIILIWLWLSGMYLFFITLNARHKKRQRLKQKMTVKHIN